MNFEYAWIKSGVLCIMGSFFQHIATSKTERNGNVTLLQMCKKNLIPSIWNSRQTPMYTIGMVQWIGLLLVGQQFASGLGVNRRVSIHSVLRNLCNVDDGNRNFHSLNYVGHHFHYLCVGTSPPVTLFCHRLCVVEALNSTLVAPVRTPENTRYWIVVSDGTSLLFLVMA